MQQKKKNRLYSDPSVHTKSCYFAFVASVFTVNSDASVLSNVWTIRTIFLWICIQDNHHQHLFSRDSNHICNLQMTLKVQGHSHSVL